MAVYAWGAPLPADGVAVRPCPGERFRQADSDGDGALNKDEALRGMPRIARNFEAIDTDHSGRVSCDELRAFIQARRKVLCEGSK
ncbi:MAG: EF-hand domain-containing protein [Gammaproteobacteria bacterium]|nr:EF-hand domain-containing protein [Gammaproteobacteria bacterium]